MSQIALDGELINLKSCKVQLSMQLVDQDMSGQSSSTASSEQGDKAKELKVSGLIPFTDKSQLSRLFELAITKDLTGNRAVWRIGSDLARAVKIRQVKFFGQITAPEHPTLLAWNVSFQLREYLSIPEVAEQRQPQTDASTGQSTEQTASVIPAAAIAKAPPKVAVSSAEKLLSLVDSTIGEPT
ncbi:DNA-binding protein [Shewanella sp. 10N.286.54.B9]|uniref:baseplate complex protein n=1 Tax=Shewanella sp. 10N.286.54.B9 TaxID=3229719 RepID=UPI00354E0613